jgi:tetracycline repressor-like protein
MTRAAVRATLRNDRLPPLDRLRAWIEGQLSYLRMDDMRRGCLYGNLSAEASEASDAIRFRVASVFAENQASVAYCPEAAIEAGELAPKTDVQQLAGFIVSSLQGAILVAKSQRSPIPVERFERVVFRHLLSQAGPSSKRRNRRRELSHNSIDCRDRPIFLCEIDSRRDRHVGSPLGDAANHSGRADRQAQKRQLQ